MPGFFFFWLILEQNIVNSNKNSRDQDVLEQFTDIIRILSDRRVGRNAESKNVILSYDMECEKNKT